MTVPNSTYTQIVSTTIDDYRDTLADNVTLHNPLLARMRARGSTDTSSGGVNLLENLFYAENGTSLWYSGYDQLSVAASDVVTSANYSWKELNANVTISGLEKAQNNGTKAQMHKLLKAKIRNLEDTLVNRISAALFYSNTENSGKSIGGLQFLVADLPTSGTVGGIDCQTQTWWRNQYYDFSTLGITASATTIQTAMNTIMMRCSRNRDMPDIFVGDTTYFGYYLASLQANQRFMDDVEAGAGFKSLKFWGGAADVIFDASAPASHMYAINSRFFHYRPHENYNFVTGDDRMPVNQDATVVPMFWKGNCTVSNRSLLGVVCA